jgi:hypothetical protein
MFIINGKIKTTVKHAIANLYEGLKTKDWSQSVSVVIQLFLKIKSVFQTILSIGYKFRTYTFRAYENE